MQSRGLALLVLLLASAAVCSATTPAQQALEGLKEEALEDVTGITPVATPEEPTAEVLPLVVAPSPTSEGDTRRRQLLQALLAAPSPAVEALQEALLGTPPAATEVLTAAPSPAAESEVELPEVVPAPEPEPMGAGVRKLLGTLTINASRGDLWAFERKTTTRVTRDPQTGKTSVGRATGTAFAANERDCLTKRDCEKPIAKVETQVVPGSATAGPAVSADAFARGERISATRTRTTSADAVRQDGNRAVGVATGSSFSVKRDGEASRSTSAVQASAFVVDGAATFFAGGTATTPYGDGHPFSNNRVDVWGRVSSPGYGYGRP